LAAIWQQTSEGEERGLDAVRKLITPAPPALWMKAFCPVPLVHAEILVEVIRERVRADESQPMRSRKRLPGHNIKVCGYWAIRSAAAPFCSSVMLLTPRTGRRAPLVAGVVNFAQSVVPQARASFGEFAADRARNQLVAQ
jgi:hypothetical protein